MPPREPPVVFLSLPLTARLRIYEYLLVCEPQVIPQCRPATERPITPSILRTCKQVHNEASSVLYSKNTFLVAEPEKTLKWFQRIGRINIKRLNSIRIFVDPVYFTTNPLFNTRSESVFWYKLLEHLAREATGLRYTYIYWDTYAWPHCGAGKDLRFVRELAKIQGLQSMVVNGFYAIHWPGFLAEKMGVQVQEKERSQSLRNYQRGTENLIP